MSVAIAPFQAIAISRLAHQLKAQGQSIVHMEFGQPSTGAPKAAIAAAHAVLDADPMGYWESPALKARIAQRYHEVDGVWRLLVYRCNSDLLKDVKLKSVKKTDD